MASKTLHESKITKGKRAPHSLATSVLVPLTLTLTIIILFDLGRRYHRLAKPFWFTPLWFIYLATLGSSFFMALAAWLVWANGGFQGESDTFSLYVGQLSLSNTWHPLVLALGVYWLASVSCLVNFGTFFLCYLRFSRINPFAKDLAKPCLVWAGYLALISFKLMVL